jgi:hypothetical protein
LSHHSNDCYLFWIFFYWFFFNLVPRHLILFNFYIKFGSHFFYSHLFFILFLIIIIFNLIPWYLVSIYFLCQIWSSFFLLLFVLFWIIFLLNRFFHFYPSLFD